MRGSKSVGPKVKKPGRPGTPGQEMASPGAYLLRMSLFLLVVTGGSLFLWPTLADAFWSNAPLNGMILLTLLLGIIYVMRQVAMLAPEAAWIDHFRQDRSQPTGTQPPRLLAPMATMLGNNRAKLSLSALAVRSLLDGLAARLDEVRDISRYMIGLLVFLGLLGTFWGLLQTISSVSGVIVSLDVVASDLTSAFGELRQGLQQPLSGMGTAFSSSLFGLSGSLVLGFLDLQAGQAQNRFYNHVEEWLASVTRLSSSLSESDQSIPVYIQALLEHTADNLNNLNEILGKSEERQLASNAAAAQLNERLAALANSMKAEQLLLQHVAETQGSLRDAIQKLAKNNTNANSEAVQAHLRTIDTCLSQIARDVPNIGTQLSKDMRNEIKLLAKTIAASSQHHNTG